ncbi:hypothetical protein BH24ACT18_BH24ACT18_04980 [soil metagenome]
MATSTMSSEGSRVVSRCICSPGQTSILTKEFFSLRALHMMNSKAIPATSGMTTTRLAIMYSQPSTPSSEKARMERTSTYRTKLVPQRTWLVSSLCEFSGTSSSPRS